MRIGSILELEDPDRKKGLKSKGGQIVNLLSKSITSFTVLIVLLLVGCDFSQEPLDPEKIQQQIATYREQERDMILTTVADPDRADQLLTLVAKRDELIAYSTNTINAFREKMTVLNADYRADRASFGDLVATFSVQREKAQQQFVAVIGEMKAVATPDEWREISRFQTKQLDPQQLVYGAAEEGT